MKTYSTILTRTDDINTFIQKENIDDSKRLLIQFFSATTDTSFISNVQSFFSRLYPLAVFLGTTSDGVINDESIYEKDESVVVFTIFEKTELVYSFVEHAEHSFNSFESGKSLARSLYSNDTKAIITFSDGIHTNGEEFLHGMSSIDTEIYIAGGMAGDNGHIKKTYVFDKERLLSNGAIGVSLNSKNLHLRSNYSFDWTPIGKRLQVTKAVKNRVYEIDGLSAVNLYSKYLGDEVASYLPQIGIEFPLMLQRDGVSIGRAVTARHEDNSLSFAGNIQEGEYVQFGVGDIETILRDTDYHVEQLTSKSKFQPEAFFIYSCMARRRFIGDYLEKEILPFAKIAPTAGFFTYGEFFHSGDKNQLLNETMTVLCMSESDTLKNFQLDSSIVNTENLGVNPLHIIAHLSNVVSKELENLNNTLEERVQKSTDYIYKQAYTDSLTLLPNRLKLIHDLEGNRNKNLILINIDDFTLVNDFYGHTVGDIVLKKIGSILQTFVNSGSASLYKLPSDEFALIVHQCLNTEELIAFIENIVSTLNGADIEHKGNSIKIAVTVASAKTTVTDTGLVNADMTLKLAKKSGLHYIIFDESLKLANQYRINLEMAQELRRAINSNDIIPYYQPIYNLKTDEIDKYECLVRLRKKDGTLLMPFSFLEMSQKIKLYPYITKIMVQKTFQTFKDNGYRFSINLSFEDMLNKEMQAFIFDNIKHYDIAKQLTIEILETQQMEDEIRVKEFIDKVYEVGADIAIDDFGSGFANFEYMTNIKSDYIKIDGSLIKNIDTDENARLIVETIIVFAQKLKKKTIAEFVHSKEVLDVVKELKIDLVQGYYLSEPLEKI